MEISKGCVPRLGHHRPARGSSPVPKDNILIDNTSHACLADFGLLNMVSDRQSVLSSHVEYRWMSPELLDPERFGLEESRPTVESDCYALGMVVYEVLIGRPPFSLGPVAIRNVLDGERPARPQGPEGNLITDGIWDVLEACWRPQPGDRPSMKAVLLGLEGNASAMMQASPTVDGDVKADSDDQSDNAASASGMFFGLIVGLIRTVLDRSAHSIRRERTPGFRCNRFNAFVL